MTLPYCTRAAVYAKIGAAAFVRPLRTVDSVSVAADIFTLRGHGLIADRPFTFALQGSPTAVLNTAASSLPAGISAATIYYASPLGADTFQALDAVGGSVVNVTSTGTGQFGIAVDFEPDLDEAILDASAWIDIHLAAHGTPVPADGGVYPRILTYLTSRMAIRNMVAGFGIHNDSYKDAAETIVKALEEDRLALERYAKGIPVPGLSAVDATPGTAEAGARSWSAASRGWGNEINNGDLT